MKVSVFVKSKRRPKYIFEGVDKNIMSNIFEQLQGKPEFITISQFLIIRRDDIREITFEETGGKRVK